MGKAYQNDRFFHVLLHSSWEDLTSLRILLKCQALI